MMLRILQSGPLVSIQDNGRNNALGHGISASGPMDHASYNYAGSLLNSCAESCIEFATGRLQFEIVGGEIDVAFSGGTFDLSINGTSRQWDGKYALKSGDLLEITPGPNGNYGYVRFNRELDVPTLIGSRATNTIARFGGLDGQCLQAGDHISFLSPLASSAQTPALKMTGKLDNDLPIRIIWGLHVEKFSTQLRKDFLKTPFKISNHIDRMGIRLHDQGAVFADQKILSLVSDAVVPGDIQILGDGTPIILMRDHQPTGGYPRIATVITNDLDRLAQMRPGTQIQFSSITVEHAHRVSKRGNGQ